MGELQPRRCSGDEHGIEHARRTAIRRGLWVGNHEEGEQQQRARLHLLHGDGKGITEVECTCEQDGDVHAEEGNGDVGTLCPGQHKACEAQKQERCPGAAAPLRGRDPSGIGEQQQYGDAEIRGVENVLAVEAQYELAADRQHGAEHEVGRRRRAQQQAQRECGDERAQRIEARIRGRARAQPLCAECGCDDEGDVGRRLVEAQYADAVCQEQPEGENLPGSRIPQRNLRHCVTRCDRNSALSMGENWVTLVAFC